MDMLDKFLVGIARVGPLLLQFGPRYYTNACSDREYVAFVKYLRCMIQTLSRFL